MQYYKSVRKYFEKTFNLVHFLHVLLLILIKVCLFRDLWLLLSIFRDFCSRYKIKALVTLSNLSLIIGHDTIPFRVINISFRKKFGNLLFFLPLEYQPTFKKQDVSKTAIALFQI